MTTSPEEDSCRGSRSPLPAGVRGSSTVETEARVETDDASSSALVAMSRFLQSSETRVIQPETQSGSTLIQVVLLAWLADYQGAFEFCKSLSPTTPEIENLCNALDYMIRSLLQAGEASMAFFPRKCKAELPRRPSTRITLEQASYVTRDGTNIGWVHASSSKFQDSAAHEPLTMLRWGGNAELAAQVVPGSPFEDLIADGLVRLMLVDYRGFGWSEGKPLLATLRADAEDFYHSLPLLHSTRGLAWPPSRSMILMGRSLGAQPALHLLAMHAEEFAGIILDSPAVCHWPLELVSEDCWKSLRDALAAVGAPPLRVGNRNFTHCACCRRSEAKKAQTARESTWLDTQDIASTMDLPLLILAGTADEWCPSAQIEAFFSASPAEEKQLVWLEGRSHNEVCLSESYWDAVFSFLKTRQRPPLH